MARVQLPSPLVRLAGDRSEIDVAGGTLLEVLRRLVAESPPLSGWVLDEHGELRQHVAIFVDGERAMGDQPLGPAALVTVVPAISGGQADGEVEVLAGTRKGLFVLRGPRGGRLRLAARVFAG